MIAGLSFRLDPDFISGFIGQQPNWGPIGYVTYKRTYARPLDTLYLSHREFAAFASLQRSEEFWLTLLRVVEGTFSIIQDHCASLRLPWDPHRAQEMAKEMYVLMWTFRFTPPGRGLWMMGTPAVAKIGAAALMNCGMVSTANIDVDFADPFCFLADMSMLGVGVGGDTKGAGKVRLVVPVCDPSPHVVADSREGWVALIRRVLNSFVGKATLPLNVDYSLVRPAGAPIMTFGGTASGPEPLQELITSLTTVLMRRALSDNPTITSDDIVDVFNLEGRCVVAGNVRRSAEIMLGEPTDDGFLELKDREKNAAALDGWRWASNNSIIAQVGQSYAKAARQTSKNGEPGFFWLENARRFGRMGREPNGKDAKAVGTNPCSEQTLFDYELCNLVETYPAHCKNVTEYKHAVKFAYLYAKAVTLVTTHNPKTNAVTMKNRRIGCSMSGIVQAMSKFGRRRFFEMCDEAYDYIQALDEEYSGWLCVPLSIKTTSVKPSGTVSLLCGATPGIHHPIAHRYWRVIRFANDSYMVPILQEAGYPVHVLDPAKEPNTTAVYFPVEEQNFERSEDDVSMWEQLEYAAQMQEHWADNQVSVTIKFDRGAEGRDIVRALELFETRLKGVSFLPKDDHGFEHAPYQPISREQYQEAVARLRPFDLNGSTTEVEDRFCDSDKCATPWKSQSQQA